MSGRKIIAVVGASGAQGGGLVRSILADRDGPYGVRAITRDPASDAARALAAAGAEVVAADLGDPGSVRRAFEGAWVIRLISRSWMRIYYFTAGSEQYLSGHKTNHLRCVVIYESGRKRKRKIAEQVAPFYFYNNVT